MEQIFEFTYRILCFTGAALACISFHYFMQRRITDSLAVKSHCGLMMVLCLLMVLSIVLLVFLPYLVAAIS